YRLNVLSLVVPPLRERREDIPLLVRSFVERTCGEMNIPVMDIAPSALAHLARQPWPGNVRELLNHVRRLVVFSNGHAIDMPLVHLVDGGSVATGSASSAPTLYRDAKKEALDIFSRNYLTELFETTRGNISETSRISGLERASIQKIIKRLNMDMGRFREK
ncbi:MAG: sigma-54-dependent Fis family transcriptional regulator, partial [Desulfobacterales bacterium]|nr:sigma-54-dependent Fis family transcriptional regulator [Desulfobacterales bacterium]